MIIAIGDELISGNIIDENLKFFSEKLRGRGLNLIYVRLPDSLSTIKNFLPISLKLCDYIITTGGLGSTPDDCTRKAIASALGKKLTFSNTSWKLIKSTLRGKGIGLPPHIKRQCYLPEGSIPLKNEIGTAVGFYTEINGKKLFALPGVPSEARWMFLNEVLPRLGLSNLSVSKGKRKLLVRTFGLRETELMDEIRGLTKLNLSIGIYPRLGGVDIELKGDFDEKEVKSLLKRKLKDNIYSWENEELEEVVAKILLKKKLKISVAESCTGGLLANLLTGVPGSSAYFMGSFVTYSPNLKENILNVSKETIRKYGTVSEECAKEMAIGARELTGSDIALSVTGVAGPASLEGKPPGTVYVGFAGEKKAFAKKFNFLGGRGDIKYKAARAALDILRREIWRR